MTNVLIINSTGHLGGAEKILLTFLDKIDKNLFNFFAITPSEGNFSDFLKSNGTAVTVIKKLYRKKFITRDDSFLSNPLLAIGSLFDLIRFSNAVSQYIKRNNIELVITNGVKASIAGGVAAKWNMIKSVWVIQDILPDNLFTKVFNLCAGSFPDKIIVISNAIKNMFPKSIHEKIKIVYPSLEQGEFDEVEEAHSLRRELNIKDDDVVFGVIGKIIPSKGIDIFLNAFSGIKKTYPSIKALIAGDSLLETADPAYIDRLKAFAKSQGLEKDAIFIDWRDDIYNVLATIDMLIHTPTRPEGFGRVLIEAMAASKPIVAFDQGALREIIDDGISGALVESLNQEALAAKLMELVQDREKRKTLGESGRRTVEERFKETDSINGFAEVINSLKQDLRS